MSRRSLFVVVTALMLVLCLMHTAGAELVGWWTFDEGTGTVAYDGTGNGNDASFNGDPQWIAGQLDGALEFDGSGDWLECADSSSLAVGGAVSVTAWFQVSAVGIDHKIGGNEDGSSGGYKMSIYNNDKVEFEIRSSANAATLNRDIAGGTTLETGVWYHVAGVYSEADGYIRTYINGVLDRELTTTAVMGVSPGPMRIGCEPYTTGSYHFNGIMDDVRVYDHAVAEEELPLIMLGGVPKELASNPSPANEAVDVPREVALGWTPGIAAATHDVYLGTSFDDVNAASRDNALDVLASQGQTAATYGPDEVLEYGQTYYWRIDEVNAAPDNTIFTGKVWSFTVEPFAYAVQDVTASSNVAAEEGFGPENTVNGSGLNELDQHSTASEDMWMVIANAGETVSIQYEFDRVYKLHEMLVWNYNIEFENILGIGLKDVTVEYSTDGVEWTVLSDVVFDQGTTTSDYTANTTVAFGGVAAQYVKLTANSTFGGSARYGLSEVRFMYIPAHAREPQPADGAADVDPLADLTWRAGREAVSHEVYLSTDEAAVADGTAPIKVVSENSYASDDAGFGQTYYWKVNEVNEAEAISVWEGDVWDFTTAEFNLIEGFETYTDDPGEEIFAAWLDGWVNETGSTVGYWETPFAEQDIVYGGGQSMPLQYDNGISPYYSEAERDFGTLDLTAAGAASLRLFVYGAADNDAETIYVALEDASGNVAAVTYSDSAVTQTEAWQKWQIPLSSFSGVNLATVETMYIGVGDRDNPSSGGAGRIFIDDIGFGTSALYNMRGDVTSPGDTVQGLPADANWPDAETPEMAIDNNSSTKFLHFRGWEEPSGIQVTPGVGATIVTEVAFTSANDAIERDPVAYELYGSNESIDGPYTLIASGDIVDFAQEIAWERLTKTETPMVFENETAYTHYRILFSPVRDPDSANSMQIAEIDLIGTIAP